MGSKMCSASIPTLLQYFYIHIPMYIHVYAFLCLFMIVYTTAHHTQCRHTSTHCTADIPGRYLRYTLCRAVCSGTSLLPYRALASLLQLGAGWFSSHSFSTAFSRSESVGERRRISSSLESGTPSQRPSLYQLVTPSSTERRLGRVRVGSE